MYWRWQVVQLSVVKLIVCSVLHTKPLPIPLKINQIHIDYKVWEECCFLLFYFQTDLINQPVTVYKDNSFEYNIKHHHK